MKKNDFFEEVSSACALDKQQLTDLVEAMVTVLGQAALEQDSVAIPGFGTFISRKTDEYITDDAGKRTLHPPHIALSFRPSVILRKNLE